MKLQPASRKEVARMAVGCSICAALLIVGLLILSLLGIGHFSYRMVTGALGGTAMAILSFTLMCLMVQSAAGTEDKKLLRAKVQASYNLRIFLQAAWVIASFFIPYINVVAAAIPLLFPTAVIYFLQVTGRLVKNSEAAPRSTPVPEDEEDVPGPFEV